MKHPITMTWDHKTAKKLLEAVEKGVYDKLTQAQADAIEDFCFELRCEVMGGEASPTPALRVPRASY